MTIPFRAAAILAVLTASAPAYAHSPRLDDAHAHLIKTDALLRAAEPQSTAHGYSQHLSRAEKLIQQAMHQIDMAAQAADAAPERHHN